ncbi:peptidoglycan-binding domain-containing protein [Vibrio diabolicus]|uniref:peptidoglycan-binding domain-containing protein n=1 Tax=Vibrio diabolicus TaxID=50719 RepID=UPI003750E412
MAGDNDKNKKGFSGLSDLASDVSDINEPIKPEPKTEAKPSTPKQSPQPQRDTSTSEPEQKSTSSPPPVEKVNTGNNEGGSGGKWILGIISVIFVIWLINNVEQSNKKSSYTQPSSSQSYGSSKSTPAPVTQTQSNTQSAGLQYTKPSVGTNNVLSVPEIRWCIREGIRIEAMRDVIDNNAGIDEFNRIVNDYNSRCGSYRYRQGSQSRAERDVEAYRSQIVSEAIREARQLGRSYQPSVSRGVSTSTAPKKPNAQYTREAQQILTDLGYDPGPVDGDYGRRTADAVKAFQRDAGITQDGWIDEDLLSTLRRAKAAYKPPVVSQPKPQSQASIQPRPSTPSTTTTAVAGYFTRGSHQDEVLRVQGRPSDISTYSASGYEEWKYGYSSVKISTRDRRVISWNNEGNLKVKLLPGQNTSNTTYFTRGSHQDDVLRVQGTPDDISIYSASGYEEWKYGYSSVKISTRDRRVLSWDDEGNLKVKLLPGSNTTSDPYFTRGSHQDDVLRVQGTPEDISTYSASGYEEWKYGYSSVKISTRDRRVLSWDNEGNLKVRYLPGSNITSGAYFSRGSHQDDVLRVQGTPEDISTYSASGYEEWKYGYSTVKISTRDRRVMSWDNSSGNLKAR